jgi:hypothetical protein
VKIHILRERVTPDQVAEMLEELKTYIKLAVDVERKIVAGGGEWHADCEQLLLDQGCRQENIWGADWYPDQKLVGFESLINIRPRQNNRTSLIQSIELQKQIEQIIRSIFE